MDRARGSASGTTQLSANAWLGSTSAARRLPTNDRAGWLSGPLPDWCAETGYSAHASRPRDERRRGVDRAVASTRTIYFQSIQRYSATAVLEKLTSQTASIPAELCWLPASKRMLPFPSPVTKPTCPLLSDDCG
jgi:hypothetical protein